MRIGLIGDNSSVFVEKLIQIWNDGNCAVIIDWRLPLKKINDLLMLSDVEKCYIANDILPIHFDGIKMNNIKYIPYAYKKERITYIPQNNKDKYLSNYDESEALILFSSGTTGNCKGIILSFRAINNNADSIMKYMNLSSDDSIYIVKSLSHSSSIIGELLVGLKAGCKIYTSSAVTPPQILLNNIENHAITCLALNPTLLKLLCKAGTVKKHIYPKLRAVYTSGSKLEIEVLYDFRKIFNDVPLLNVYGLTEAGPRVTAQTLFSNNLDGSVGRAINNVEIKIDYVNFTDNCGEICVKTNSLYSGYVSGIDRRVSSDGWLHTGDIGYIDDNENLFVIGRKDTMIIVGAHNVFPEQIEKIVQQSGMIDDCIVYAKRDNIFGEKIVCDYVLKSNLNVSLLKKYCYEQLAPYEIPKEFNQVDMIETTHNGKKKRGSNGN